MGNSSSTTRTVRVGYSSPSHARRIDNLYQFAEQAERSDAQTRRRRSTGQMNAYGREPEEQAMTTKDARLDQMEVDRYFEPEALKDKEEYLELDLENDPSPNGDAKDENMLVVLYGGSLDDKYELTDNFDSVHVAFQKAQTIGTGAMIDVKSHTPRSLAMVICNLKVRFDNRFYVQVQRFGRFKNITVKSSSLFNYIFLLPKVELHRPIRTCGVQRIEVTCLHNCLVILSNDSQTSERYDVAIYGNRDLILPQKRVEFDKIPDEDDKIVGPERLKLLQNPFSNEE